MARSKGQSNERDAKFYRRTFFGTLNGEKGFKIRDGEKTIRLATVIGTAGGKLLLEIDMERHMCRYISQHVAADYAIEMSFARSDEEWLLPRQAKELISLWVSSSKPIKEPCHILWADEPGLCFARLPWAKDEPVAPTPTLDELVSRCSNRAAFRAFIASIFVHGSYNQQYLWLVGKGGVGKGSLIKALSNVINRVSYVSEDISAMEDKYWSSSAVVGKRLVMFSEVRDRNKTMTSGKFLALTGGDSVQVRYMNKEPMEYAAKVKVVLASNEMPTIDDSGAHQRRAVLVKIQNRVGKIDPNYGDRIEAELGSFVRRAILEDYAVLCPTHGPIPTDSRELDEHLEDSQVRYQHIADTHLVFGAGASCTPAQLWGAVESEFRTQYDFSKFKSWILSLTNARKDPIVVLSRPHESVRVLVGVKPRNISQENLNRANKRR